MGFIYLDSSWPLYPGNIYIICSIRYIQEITYLCILATNVATEKVFIFLWFWWAWAFLSCHLCLYSFGKLGWSTPPYLTHPAQTCIINSQKDMPKEEYIRWNPYIALRYLLLVPISFCSFLYYSALFLSRSNISSITIITIIITITITLGRFLF